MKSNEHGFAIIGILLMLVLTAGVIAGYFFLQNQQTPTPQQSSPQPSPSADLTQEINPIPTSAASPSPAATAPVVVFDAAGSFSDSEEEQIRTRVVNPFIAYHQDIEGQADIVSMTISHSSGTLESYPYGADAIFANGAHSSFLISTTDGVVDWYLPDCLGDCSFSENFRANYPEIVSQLESTP